jgi:acyl-CoA dehydrogenase
MFSHSVSPRRLPKVSKINLLPRGQIEKFVEEDCIPAEAVYQAQLGTTTAERFGPNAHPEVIEELKVKAKKLGLWNMFLPKNHFKEGAGFSNLEYGLMAEVLGKCGISNEVGFGCVFGERGVDFGGVED